MSYTHPLTGSSPVDPRTGEATFAEYARDMKGYGRDVPHAQWPNGARIAVSFVLNYEEGGENSPLHGDPTTETFLSEMVTAAAFENRHMTMESMYEYGSRAGVWRILRAFEQHGWPLTIFGVGMAMQRYPELVKHFMDADYEIANHGLRWIHYQNLPEATERRHIGLGTHVVRDMTGGQWPVGWYTGRDSPNTRRLVADQGGYEYDSDYYGDDLPFWLNVEKTDGGKAPMLVVPYSLDTNDMRCVQANGFNTGDAFFAYLRDTFDALYAEGDPAGLDRPKMMSIGMHCRLLGKPGRIAALQRFLAHVAQHDQVWVARRVDIARHWKQVHPFDESTAHVWR